LNPDPLRKKLFSGIEFGFLLLEQLNKAEDLITRAGGTTIELKTVIDALKSNCIILKPQDTVLDNDIKLRNFVEEIEDLEVFIFESDLASAIFNKSIDTILNKIKLAKSIRAKNLAIAEKKASSSQELKIVAEKKHKKSNIENIQDEKNFLLITLKI